MKICSKCTIEKSLDQFAKDTKGKNGLRAYCRSCCKIVRDKYYRENRDKVININKQWKLNNPEKNNAINRKKRVINKVKVSLGRKVYRLKYAAKIYSDKQKRRAIKINAIPKFANKKIIDKIYEYAKQLNNEGLNVHVDHIVPLMNKNVSGFHVEWNLRIIPAKDNLAKNNTLIDTFICSILDDVNFQNFMLISNSPL